MVPLHPLAATQCPDSIRDGDGGDDDGDGGGTAVAGIGRHSALSCDPYRLTLCVMRLALTMTECRGSIRATCHH